MASSRAHSLLAGTSLRLPAPAQRVQRGRVRRDANSRRQPSVLITAGMFDFFKEDPQAKARKEEEFRRQQEVLQRRKSGAWKEDVDERRAKVRRYNTDKDFKEQVDAERRSREPKEEDPPLGSIIIPLAPFGMPKYDLGERFDLKGPYVDNGWVDEDADVMKKVGGLFKRSKKDNGEGNDKE